MSSKISKQNFSLKKFINSPLFNNIILVLVFINSVIIGLQIAPMFAENELLQTADKFFLCIFILEIILKILVNRKFFFYDKWNVFDAAIIICSLVFTLSTLTVFRIFRIFRLLKSVRALRYMRIMRFLPNNENLQKIIASISRAIPKILSAGFLLILVFYIYAVLGISVYGKGENSASTDFFGSFVATLGTLFQTMTGDSWASGIVRKIQNEHPSIWLYSISFFIIANMTILGVVTGVLVDSVRNVSENFDKGGTKYGGSRHIVILGFNEIALYVLEQINSYEKDSSKFFKQKVLILDNGDADKNRQKILDKLGDENCLSVNFITGEIDEKENLEKCNVCCAKSILLLGEDETITAKIILTVRSLWEEDSLAKKYIPYFATVVNDDNICNSLKKAFPPETNRHIHILSGEKIISNIMAHSCRKAGFAEIFKELFTSEKNEIYIKEFHKDLFGERFSKATLCYPKSTLIGFVNSEGKTFINPSKNEKIEENCKGIFLGETSASIKYKKTEFENIVKQSNSFSKEQQTPFEAKHLLFVGCNRFLKNILSELNNYVGTGSEATICTNEKEKKEFAEKIENLSLSNFPEIKFNDKINLQDLTTIPESTQVIVFLTNSLKETNKADSEVLMNLLTLIGSLPKECGTKNSKYRLLCEMRKIENQSIAPKKNDSLALNGLEYVVGNRLTSQILAQIALDEQLHGIYEELLASAGSEFYMRKPSEYGFADGKNSVVEITQKIISTNEIFIGYKNSNGVHLNPSKTENVNFSDDVDLIVLSEE